MNLKPETEIATRKIEDREFKILQCIKENKKFFIKSNFDKDNWRKIALRYLQESFTFALLNKEIFEHKQSCERFLGFLEMCLKYHKDTGTEDYNFIIYMLKPKIKDLQGAIKVYEDGGVR